MIKDNNRKKKRKHNADSSAEMIDSFFGSQKFDNNETNHENTTNFKETEEMIDEILEKKDKTEKSDESFHPTVEVFEKNTPETTNQNSSPSEKHTTNHHAPNSPTFHEKEEIFEIDKPQQDEKQKKKKENEAHKSKQTKKKAKRKNITNEKLNDKGKIKFSLNLPKFNIKFGSKNKQQKKSADKTTTKDEGKQKEEVQSQIQKPCMSSTKGSGRIHGISKVTKKDKPDPQKKIQRNKPKEQKKGLFSSSEKPFNLFKRKTNKKTKKPSKSESTDHFTPEMKKDPINQNQIHSSSTETSIPTKTIDEDVIHLLKITDELLGKLPEDVIEDFSQSDDFILYEKVMKKYDIIK